jgi:hypothetical protein
MNTGQSINLNWNFHEKQLFRLNMALDLQSLFGLHVHCAQLYSLAETPQPAPPPTPSFGLKFEGAIGQPR